MYGNVYLRDIPRQYFSPWTLMSVQYKATMSPPASPRKAKSSISFTTACINPSVYLPYLVSQCLQAGVTFTRGNVQHIQDVGKLVQTDLIVNCTGLNAVRLGGVGDPNVFPARGQVVIVSNKPPLLKSMLGLEHTEDADAYIIPRPAGAFSVIYLCISLGIEWV